MFPHTITIYNSTDDSYRSETFKGVYWYGGKQKSQSGKGKEDSGSITVVIPMAVFKQVDSLGITLDGSIIVKGLHSPINSIRELNGVRDCITVTSVEINDVGSPLDHVTVHGS